MTSDSTSLTLTGGMFGIDADSVTVTVADTDCVVSTISDTEIICELGAVPAGVHNIIVTTQLYGEWLM